MDFLPRLLIAWALCALAFAILWAVRRWDDPPPTARRTPPPVPATMPVPTARVGWTQVNLGGTQLYSTTRADSGELGPARAA